jgi:hypothetical protein
MIFPGRESGLRLDFEEWGHYGKYYHDIYSAFIVPEDVYFKKMNCILYPGETGVVTFDLSQICLELGGCQGPAGEDLTSPPKQLGYQLIGYQGLYRRWEDLKDKYPFKREYPAELDKRYQPLADNLVYSIRYSEISINFDIKLFIPKYVTLFYESSWIVLYDNGGQIINILYSRLTSYMTEYLSGIYHIYGVGTGSNLPLTQWTTPDVYTQRWKPMIYLTPEDLQRVDHIRVLNETQDDEICIKPLH